MNNKLVKLDWSISNTAWHWVEGMSLYNSSGKVIVDRDELMNEFFKDGVFVKREFDDVTYSLDSDGDVRDVEFDGVRICKRGVDFGIAIVGKDGRVETKWKSREEVSRLFVAWLSAFNPEVIKFDGE